MAQTHEQVFVFKQQNCKWKPGKKRKWECLHKIGSEKVKFLTKGKGKIEIKRQVSEKVNLISKKKKITEKYE